MNVWVPAGPRGYASCALPSGFFQTIAGSPIEAITSAEVDTPGLRLLPL
jgi:hypothetical protein